MDADHLELVSDGGLVQSECVDILYMGADLVPRAASGVRKPGPAPVVRAEKENDFSFR